MSVPPAATEGATAPTSFSAEIRGASWDAHERAAQAPFMAELVAGRAGRAGYAHLVAQHWYAYEVLEQASEQMAKDPIAGPFVIDGLERLPVLEEDLRFLLGASWRDQVKATTATQDYCLRMREVCFDWPGGFVAHHYVRYMGDMSGGQFLRRVVAQVYELPDEQGARFYDFDSLGDLDLVKEAYRRDLDVAPWGPDERERIISEILLGYELNTRVLEELAA